MFEEQVGLRPLAATGTTDKNGYQVSHKMMPESKKKKMATANIA